MKKIILAFALSAAMVGSVLADNYRLDETSLEAAFAASEDISLVASNEANE